MTADEALAEIRRLYYKATKSSIQNDLTRAVQLLKSMPTEDDRDRAAVYMDGLAQMRSEWAVGGANQSGMKAVDRKIAKQRRRS
jgi:hypothetical protein